MPWLAWLDVSLVKQLLQVSTITETVAELQRRYPDKKIGLRNFQRFMSENNIKLRKSLSNDELEKEVRTATDEVGGTYGRRMMQGYLRTKDVRASRERIRQAQSVVAAQYQANRRNNTQRQTNPQPYSAPHFGYNWHIDQNEKCGMYGVTLVMGVDGLSNYITSASIMPRKNNITIYRDVYCPAVEQFGLFGQTISDKGKENFLLHFIQDHLKVFRVDQSTGILCTRDPFRQTTSQTNNRSERLWVESNQRVVFPIKEALTEMEDNGQILRGNPTHMFATGTVGRAVANLMLQRFIDSWNQHSIPGKGAPADYVSSRGNYVIPANALPTPEAAVQMYEAAGGRIVDEWEFGVDPLKNDAPRKAVRDETFWSEVDGVMGGVANLANRLANKDYAIFQHAVLLFIQLST